MNWRFSQVEVGITWYHTIQCDLQYTVHDTYDYNLTIQQYADMNLKYHDVCKNEVESLP